MTALEEAQRIEDLCKSVAAMSRAHTDNKAASAIYTHTVNGRVTKKLSDAMHALEDAVQIITDNAGRTGSAVSRSTTRR